MMYPKDPLSKKAIVSSFVVRRFVCSSWPPPKVSAIWYLHSPCDMMFSSSNHCTGRWIRYIHVLWWHPSGITSYRTLEMFLSLTISHGPVILWLFEVFSIGLNLRIFTGQSRYVTRIFLHSHFVKPHFDFRVRSLSLYDVHSRIELHSTFWHGISLQAVVAFISHWYVSLIMSRQGQPDTSMVIAFLHTVFTCVRIHLPSGGCLSLMRDVSIEEGLACHRPHCEFISQYSHLVLRTCLLWRWCLLYWELVR